MEISSYDQHAARFIGAHVVYSRNVFWLGIVCDCFGGVTTMSAYRKVYLPNDGELMAARGAIVSYVDSIARGNLEPRTEVLNTIIKAAVLAMRWRPESIAAAPTQENAHDASDTTPNMENSDGDRHNLRRHRSWFFGIALLRK